MGFGDINSYTGYKEDLIDKFRQSARDLGLPDRTEMRFYQNKPLSLDMGYQKN